jgi:hypothetical protein
LEEEVEAWFNDEGGRDEESKSWGKREIACEDEDNAELVEDDDPLRFNDVGDGGGDGFGRPVMIFAAGRMSLLTWPFFVLLASDIPRRRRAPTGISMYSSVAIVVDDEHTVLSVCNACNLNVSREVTCTYLILSFPDTDLSLTLF